MHLLETIAKLKNVSGKVANLAARPDAARPDRGLMMAPTPAINPGGLHAWTYLPADLAPGAALVVVLHGCTQTAADYDRGSGWSALADRHGFALLYPEQARANNPNNCFNWFSPGDIRRGGGEVASIHAQIAAMIAAHAIDPARVFVTGLSAGGAMTAALLAAYPEAFAAGAIIAGLPYGCASGVPQALEAMSGRGAPADAATLGDRVRAASPHAGRWPRVSVWHGEADHTVAPACGQALVAQWTNVHGLPPEPSRTDGANGHHRSLWSDADGTPIVEHHRIDGMGHGTPLRPGTGPGEAGEARPHMLDVGISSTDGIAAFFGIARVNAGREERRAVAQQPRDAKPPIATPASPSVTPAASGPQKVIEDALRAAGLMQ